MSNQIEVELGVTDADRAVLKGIKRVWDRLETLRKQAEKDPKARRTYRDLLSKSLQQARSASAPGTAEQVAAEAQELWLWVDAEMLRLDIEAIAARRGGDCFAWCERWLPELYAEYGKAIGRMIELPSRQHIDDVKLITSKLLQAFVGAI